MRKIIPFCFCLVGGVLFYFVVYHQQRASHVSSLMEFISNRSNETRCLRQLALHLKAHATNPVNVSYTYIQLPQPMPIGEDCRELFADWVSPSPAPNISKLQHINAADQLRIHSIAHQLLTNFSQRKLEIFLAGGSLLGSVRHFGFFPWDADLDFMVLSSQKQNVRELLVDLSSSDEFSFVDSLKYGHYQLGLFCQVEHNKTLVRLYGRKQLYPQKKCKTIADFFFGWNDKKFYYRSDPPRSFPLSNVYPLSMRPFGPHLFPAPGQPLSFLTAVYGGDYESKCHLKYFKHLTFDCKSLHSEYPFVAHMSFYRQGGVRKGNLLHLDVLVHRAMFVALFRF